MALKAVPKTVRHKVPTMQEITADLRFFLCRYIIDAGKIKEQPTMKLASSPTNAVVVESIKTFNKILQKISLVINKSAEGIDPYMIEVSDENNDCTGSCDTCAGCK